ncbi:MAG TPA: hypothetical protein VFA21_21790 [Pyrinomonadaceae bacterium]|nr:hypothetical protein [Pyrinomonadaceae bacterium]
MSVEQVEFTAAGTKNTEGARSFEISNLKFSIPPCDLRVLRVSVVNFNALFAQESIDLAARALEFAARGR